MHDPRRLDETARTLDVLGVLFYVHAGLTAFFSLFPLLYLAIGVAALTGHLGEPQPGSEDDVVGVAFVIFGATFTLGAWTVSVLDVLTGRLLRQRRRRFFCTIGAAVTCLSVPFGTGLGVVTLVFLNRAEAEVLFGLTTGEPVTARPVDAAPL